MGKVVDNKFTWLVEDFSSLQSKKIYSDEFVIGGCIWRLLVHYNKEDNVDYVSLHLDVVRSESLPCGWRRLTSLKSIIVNQMHEELSKTHEIKRWFSKGDCESFKAMIFLTSFDDKDFGYFVNGYLKIVVEINVLEVFGGLDLLPTKSLSLKDDSFKKSSGFLEQAKETIEINGFQVLPSQVEYVRRIFEKHPDIASNLSRKNKHLKTGYINVLLGLIKTMCQPIEQVSKDDLTEADAAIDYLTEAGLDLDWLEEKIDKVSVKKDEEEASETRMLEIEQELKDLKVKCANLEAELDKEKANVCLSRAQLSFEDVV